jgi:hypothetical protein
MAKIVTRATDAINEENFGTVWAMELDQKIAGPGMVNVNTDGKVLYRRWIKSVWNDDRRLDFARRPGIDRYRLLINKFVLHGNLLCA